MMNDGRKLEADAGPTARDDNHLLLLSKVPNTGACPEDVVKRASHGSMVCLSTEGKGMGSVCCSKRGA